MKKIALIIYILTSILFASEEEIEHKEILKISKETIAHLSEVLKYKSKGVKFLLSPMDFKTTLLVVTTYDKKYKDFENKKKNLKNNISVEELSTFYIDTLQQNTSVEFTDMLQYLARLDYERYILYHLKKDLDKNNISTKDRMKLLLHLEKLLLLDTSLDHKLIVAQNNFYAKNMKKYINIMKNEPRKNIIYNDETYKKFLFYLNKTEVSLFLYIAEDRFQFFKKSIKEELALIRKNTSNKMVLSTSEYTDYWIRTQVAMRYYVTSYFSLKNTIEKNKTLFYDLFPVDSE